MSVKWRLFYGVIFLLVGPLVFLGVERWYGVWGFPLDDAWIHQTYARGLASGAGWSYAGGPPSAGSTSPAWTFLQMPAYWLPVSPVIWSYGLGFLLFAAVVFLSFLIMQRLDLKIAWIAVIVVAWEWHLVWASLSGMETMLFTAWVLLVWWHCLRNPDPTFWGDSLIYGMVLGAGVWIRPEGMLAAGFGGLCLLGRYISCKEWGRVTGLIIGSVVMGCAFFLHNYQLEGRLWPNTMYAKPLEYAVLQSVDFPTRIWESIRALNAGPLVIIFGLAWIPMVSAVRQRRWRETIPLIWGLCHVSLYAAQLPVTYQHARYVMPVIPVFLAYGLVGWHQIRSRLALSFLGQTIYRAAMGSIGAIATLFLLLGARQYALDVGIIETEMVRASQWIQLNTPATAHIAAHDVGALGYWGRRSIIDLGGLTNANAWPLLQGQESVETFLTRQKADYWMTFPDTYPSLTRQCRGLFSTKGTFAGLSGGTNMMVFKWPEGCEP
jgi:hypothetical protein